MVSRGQDRTGQDRTGGVSNASATGATPDSTNDGIDLPPLTLDSADEVDRRLGTGKYAQSGPNSYQELKRKLSKFSQRNLENIVKKATQQGGIDNTTSRKITAFEDSVAEKFPGCNISSLIVNHINSALRNS